MEDKTSQQLYDKYIEVSNLILGETAAIRRENAQIIDQMDPTYSNVRNIHQMVYNLAEEVKKLKREIAVIREIQTGK